MAKISNKTGTVDEDDYLKRVRDLSRDVEIREVREYGKNQKPTIPMCGCYKVVSPYCKSCPLWIACPLTCGGCTWYNCFMCACGPNPEDGSYYCQDMKMQEHVFVTMDKENGTLGYYNLCDPDHVGFYCLKIF
jgi:hypothetical protein